MTAFVTFVLLFTALWIIPFYEFTEYGCVRHKWLSEICGSDAKVFLTGSSLLFVGLIIVLLVNKSKKNKPPSKGDDLS